MMRVSLNWGSRDSRKLKEFLPGQINQGIWREVGEQLLEDTSVFLQSCRQFFYMSMTLYLVH
jgi:hypothetical protein